MMSTSIHFDHTNSNLIHSDHNMDIANEIHVPMAREQLEISLEILRDLPVSSNYPEQNSKETMPQSAIETMADKATIETMAEMLVFEEHVLDQQEQTKKKLAPLLGNNGEYPSDEESDCEDDDNRMEDSQNQQTCSSSYFKQVKVNPVLPTTTVSSPLAAETSYLSTDQVINARFEQEKEEEDNEEADMQLSKYITAQMKTRWHGNFIADFKKKVAKSNDTVNMKKSSSKSTKRAMSIEDELVPMVPILANLLRRIYIRTDPNIDDRITIDEAIALLSARFPDFNFYEGGNWFTKVKTGTGAKQAHELAKYYMENVMGQEWIQPTQRARPSVRK